MFNSILLIVSTAITPTVSNHEVVNKQFDNNLETVHVLNYNHEIEQESSFYAYALESEQEIDVESLQNNLTTVDFDTRFSSSGSSACNPSKHNYCWQYGFIPTTAVDYNQMNYDTCWLASTAKVGDIIYETASITGHIAVVTGIKTIRVNGVNRAYVEIIEAVHDDDGGVTRSVIDCDRFKDKSAKLLRVDSATTSQISEVVSLLESQLDKNYSIKGPTCNFDKNAWFCSKLAFCAYKEVGIRISGYGFYPLPADISAHSATREVFVSMTSSVPIVTPPGCASCTTIVPMKFDFQQYKYTYIWE